MFLGFWETNTLCIMHPYVSLCIPMLGHPNIYNSGPQAPPFATAPPRSFPLTVLRRTPIAAEGPLALTKFLTDGIKHLQILLVPSGYVKIAIENGH
jgi:hypothetical protein